MLRRLLFVVLVFIVLDPLSADELHTQQRFRRPAAVVAADGFVFTANRRSGTISVVGGSKRKLVAEIPVGEKLADLAQTPEGGHLLAVDEERHELILLVREGRSLEVTERLAVSHSPVSVCVSPEGRFCSVASLWAQRVTLVKLPAGGSGLKILKVIDLPFAPRAQQMIKNGRYLIVADAAAGRLGVIDTRERTLRSVLTFSGHNIRGLATSFDGDELLMPHQLLNEYSTTTRDRVFWGGVLGNVLRSITLEELLARKPESAVAVGRAHATDSVVGRAHPTEQLGGSLALPGTFPTRRLAHWSLHPLGRPGSATGDPGAILVTKKGQAVVCLSGVNEIALRSKPTQPFVRLPVGLRPTALAADADEKQVYVANTFDDSLSVLDLETMKIVETIPLGPQPRLSPAEKGERLFYNARLALDGWYSCHSCHTDGHSNGLLNDNLGDGSFGYPKRVLSLLGTGETGPWAWNGGREDLRVQIKASMTSTMQGKPGLASEENIRAIEAYLRTLEPPPALSAARGVVDHAAVRRGRRVFRQQGCADCHQPPTYTSPGVYDVGFGDKEGPGEFNPPSLRGVSQRGPFFHDNRAATLREVFAGHKHGESGELTSEKLSDLLEFLKSL